ncbi:MAG: amidinotransferase [Halobacteriovoraceae bacterium]|jgi:N-dimethylarginine dimethylaminohydrolase|nr:amidinotransferase [Halobacteriovoraceae bacterium]MBT5095600.1 amidinotransferase [Halobacteriovoraceae bacterium]
MIRGILMVTPEYYDVTYAINPHMKNSDGSLKKVDKMKATREWGELTKAFLEIGIPIKIINGVKNLPDMVFAANQTFPLLDGSFVLSNMSNPERAEEIEYFKNFLHGEGLRYHELNFGKYSFEGMGDAIWHPKKRLVWGGHGFRTDLEAYDILEDHFNLDIIPLKLKREEFYHLDTCLVPIDSATALFVESAFDKESLVKLQHGFENLIPIPEDEALKNFAGNAFCPDGHHVVMQSGSKKTMKLLGQLGLEVLEVETSEFIKGGGSVFCLKGMYF